MPTMTEHMQPGSNAPPLSQAPISFPTQIMPLSPQGLVSFPPQTPTTVYIPWGTSRLAHGTTTHLMGPVGMYVPSSLESCLIHTPNKARHDQVLHTEYIAMPKAVTIGGRCRCTVPCMDGWVLGKDGVVVCGSYLLHCVLHARSDFYATLFCTNVACIYGAFLVVISIEAKVVGALLAVGDERGSPWVGLLTCCVVRRNYSLPCSRLETLFGFCNLSSALRILK